MPSNSKSLSELLDDMYSDAGSSPAPSFDEEKFRSWYGGMSEQYGLAPDPDDPKHFYDYRKAFTAGAAPDEQGHWPSEFKTKGHPRQIVRGMDTRTGERVFPETKYDDLIDKASEEHGVPYEIMYRLLHQESRFNPKAISPKGAQGIAQFMPDTAKDEGLRDPFDPTQAIPASARYLKKQYDRFGDWKLAAAAYNAGPKNVEKHKGVPPFAETLDYVKKIFPDEDLEEADTAKVAEVESPDLDQLLAGMFPEGKETSQASTAPLDPNAPFNVSMKKSEEEKRFEEKTKSLLAPHRNLVNTLMMRGFGKNQGDRIDELGRPVDAEGNAYVNEQLAVNKIAAETLSGLTALATHPMEVIRGGLDFFLSLPAFGIGLIAAVSQGTGELVKQGAYGTMDLDKVYGVMSKSMEDSFRFFEPGKELIVGKPTEESMLVGEVAMAPLNAISATGQAVASYEGFKDSPNIRGAAKIAADALALIAMGFIVKGRSRRQELSKGVEDITKEADQIRIKAEEIRSNPDAVLRSIQERVLAVEKERLEYKAKQFAEQFGDDLLLVEEIGRQLERDALEKSRPVVESRPEMAEGKWTEEGKPERRSTKYVPASEEATRKNFPPSKEVDSVINRYRMDENLWVDESGNHRIDNYKDAAKIARERGGTVLPTTEGKWAVALEPQKRVKYELDAIKSEPAKEGAPKKEATPSKDQLKVERKKKVEPKVEKKKKDDIPELKLTQDAVAFGEKATPGQLAEIERRSGEIKDQVNELVKSADFESRAQEITDLAYRAQLYNEALQASRGEHPSQLQKKAQQTVKKINDLAEKEKPKEKKPVVVVKKKAGKPKVEEKPKEVEPEVDEVMPEEHLKMLDRLIEDIEVEAKKADPKKAEAVNEVDRATGSGPGVEKSNGIFFQDKEKSDGLAKIFDERKKQVESDPEVYLQKLINDVNRWYHGENIDIKATREALSTLAGKASEMRDFFMAGVDHIQFVDIAGEAAKWARSVGRPKAGVGGGTQLNMMIPLDQMPDTIKKILRMARKSLREKGRDISPGKLFRNSHIFDLTGFWLGRDGKWRYEVNDRGADILMIGKTNPKDMHVGNSFKLDKLLEHETLYEHIPELRDVTVHIKSAAEMQGALGQAGKSNILISEMLINDPYMLMRTLLHEVSHVVNKKVRAFRGSSPEQAGSLKAYWEVPGEMEARLVARRMDMTEAQRKAERPWETLDKMLAEEADLSLPEPKQRINPRAGVNLYSGIPIDKAAADLIAGARKIHDYMKKARGMKEFKPAEAAKLVRAELNKGFIDRSGNLRVELLDKLGDIGYEVVQKMYLAKGASSKAASMLKQMGGEVYEGLSKVEREVLDALILADRMIDIGKTRGEKEFNYPGGAKLVDFVTYSELFPQIEKLDPIRADLIRQRAAAYFEWMKKPLAEMLEAGLISKEEFDKLSKHQYRRIKLVDIYDKRYGSTIGGRKRTVYDSGVEALSRGKGTDIYEPSSEVMALEVYNRAYGRIYNNAANQVLAEVAKTNKDNPFVKIKEKKGDKIPSGWHRVFYYEGGKRKSIYVNPEFSSEWITRSPEISYKMAQLIRHASGSSVLRTFATGIDWGFALANLPRDVMHAWFAAREFKDGKWQPTYSTFAPTFGAQMGIDMSTIFRDAVKRKGRYLDYINEGGGMEFLVHQGRLLQRGRHLEGNIDKIYNFMGYLGETTEIMTRLAIRERVIKNKAREQGISVEQAKRNKKITQEATFAARDYMDFGQGGSISKAVDNGIPYLNAAIQGSRGMFRSFKGGSGAESVAKLTQLAAITTGVYLATMYNAPETFKQLKGSEDSKNNLIIPLGDSFGFLDEYGQMRYPYFKIPLDPGQKFFKTFFEGAADKWLGNEVDVDRITEALKEQAPVDISQLPPTMSAAFGYMYNKDFWRNEDIFKGANKPFSWPKSAAEFDKNTPEIYRDLGSVTGLSPERTKYAVEQLFTKNSMWKALGGKAYDEAFGDLPKSQKEQHLARMMAETPVVRRFIGVTNPYSKHASKIEQAEEKSVVDRFVQSRDMDIVVESYLYDKTATIEDVINEARKHQDLDTYNRLIDRFKWEAAIVDLPEKSFWKRLKGLNPEAKAEVFVHRLNKANETEKEQLWNEFSIVAGAGDVVTDSFRREVFKLMGNQ